MVTELFIKDIFCDVIQFAWRKFSDVSEGPVSSIFGIGTSEVWGWKEGKGSAG